ncbi:MAG: SpoIID/LytB domain-containing protein [Elusimicrobiaceae bacterium]|nr:SpoIID/LytB domain-containing protein [Elusimicrobiaceae bacterium]
MKKIILFCLLVAIATLSYAQQTVRVQLAEDLTKAQVQTSGRVYIYALNNSKKYKVSRPETIDILWRKGKLQIGALTSADTLVIEPDTNVILTFQKNTYTGKFYLIPAKNTFRVVEYTDLENYLLGVLPYEMSYSWPVEALKAQAVAARTYTLMQIQNNKKTDFDLYNDVRSQMYKGSAKVYDSVRQAVEGTQGKVLKYKGELFNTYYHANCGGGTDDAKIWTGNKNATIKPLQGASCSTDSHSKSYTWSNTIALSSINKFVNKNGLSGSVTKIKVQEKTHTKRAVTLQFTTKQGSKTLSCAQFRLAVGASLLKSCKITDISKHGSDFTFAGRGYGHGVGMCQDGAKGMAQEGKDYKQILSNYFPSSDLTTL